MQEAASGSRTQADAFHDVGVSATDVEGDLRSADDVLLDIADRFETMPDGAAKSAMAMDLFGKSGAKMIPLLNQGSDAIREQMQLARQLGLIVSNETAAAADEFADQMQVLSQVGQGFANRLTAELLPTLTNVGDVLIETAADGDTMATASDALSTILKGLVSAGLWVGHTFSQLGKDIGAFAAAAVAAASGDFSAAHDIITDRNAESATDSETFSRRMATVWSDTADNADQSATKQLTALTRTSEGQKKAADEAEKAAERQLKSNAQMVASLQEQAATLGMTAGQAQVFALQMNGATDAQIRAAEAARKTVDAFAALKELGNIKIGAMDGDDAAVASLQEKYARLNEIIAANPELQQQATEAAAMLAQQYQNNVDAQIAAGQAGHDAFIEQQAQRVDAIKTQYATEIELAIQKHATDQEMLEQALLNGVITRQAYNDIAAQNETDHEANMSRMKLKSWKDLEKLTKQSWQTQASVVSGTLADMTAGMANKSRAMFEINKRAAQVNAAIKGKEAIMGAYAAGNNIGGPYVGAAFAAVAGAFVGAQLNAIETTSYGSGANSTTSGIPSAATSVPTNAPNASAPAAASQTLAVTGLDGDQIFDGKTVRALAERLIQFQRDGGKVVLQ